MSLHTITISSINPATGRLYTQAEVDNATSYGLGMPIQQPVQTLSDTEIVGPPKQPIIVEGVTEEIPSTQQAATNINGTTNNTIGSYEGSATPAGTAGVYGFSDGSNRLGTPPATDSTGMFGLSESDVGLVGAGVNLVGTGLTYNNTRLANNETRKNNAFNRELAREDADATKAYRASYV